MKIYDILKNIEKNKVINSIESPYWIYDLSMETIQMDGKLSKTLYISLFERNLQLKEGLSKLTFRINGIEANITKFEILDKFRIRCKTQLPIEQNKITLYLQSYTNVQGDEIYLNTNSYIQGVVYHEDEKKLEFCKDILGKENYVLAPDYNNILWFCGCGRIHSNEEETCNCGNTLDKQKEICDINIKEFVLSYAKEKFEVDLNKDVVSKLNSFANAMFTKYGVDSQEIVSLFNQEELKKEQSCLIKNEIDSYISNINIKFNFNKSFDENIKMYAEKGKKGIITSQMIIDALDKETLSSQYESERNAYLLLQQKRQEQHKKKVILIGCLCILLLMLSTAVYMLMPKPEKALGITLQDTIETRKENYILQYDEADTEQVCIDAFNGYASSGYEEYITKNETILSTFEKLSIDSVDEFLNEYYISTNIDHINVDVSLPSIQIVNGKEVKAISNDHFFVKETIKQEDGTDKILFYIGDDEGNKVFGDDTDYIIVEYKDDKIYREYIYKNNEISFKRTYQYNDKELLKSHYYSYSHVTDNMSDKKNWTLQYKYEYENGMVSKKIEYMSDDQIVSLFKYTEKKLVLVQSSYKNYDGYKEESHYKNGLLNKRTVKDGEHIRTYKYIYDENGLIIKINYTSNIYNDVIVRYIYDLENGILYVVNYEYTSSEYALKYINTASFNDGFSHGKYYNEITASDFNNLSLIQIDYGNDFSTVYDRSLNNYISNYTEHDYDDTTEEPVIPEDEENKEQYFAGVSYPIGRYELQENLVLVRRGPDNKKYEILKNDNLPGDTKNDNKAMLAIGTILEIEEIEHSSSGYWGKIKGYDDAWICLYYETSNYNGNREFCSYID